MSSRLFTPLRIGELELANRIAIAPMCQYSAVDGSMTDWHLMHLGTLALSGAGMLTIEATGVRPDGRITSQCVGLYSDANEAAIKRVVEFCRSISPIRIGIQLSHAGRKGSSQRPWEGRGPLEPGQGAWETVAPSALPLAAGWPTPLALALSEMESIKQSFVAAAQRSASIGLDYIELHSTHGYLLAEFLSPLANRRTDDYGGSLENRMRFPLEVFAALRKAWPAGKPLGAKITGSDFAAGGWTPDEAVVYARELKKLGCDYVTVSGGGTVLDAKIPVGPGYQVPFAEQVLKETGITTGAIGLITDAQQAEQILAGGKADFIALARAMLFNPRWPQHAAVTLGVEAAYAPQYERAAPKAWRPGRTLGKVG
ncbi:MAG: NADH:flavin oxidoreductase/NADH oxidase [Burkholderiales bacterium]|nr:NADH:flavin oxidoreductase/NADH oxidase [Burkholderiales bacterium]